MASRFEVERADLAFEAGYAEPAFELLRDVSGLLRSLYSHLTPHGMRLTDMKVERGGNSVIDHHVFCYLFNFVMTARVRVERIEVTCSEFPRAYVEKFGAAIVAVVRAVQQHAPHIRFRAHAMGVSLHGRIDGTPAREYLSQFAAGIPDGLGPSTGNGAVFYFGQDADQLLSSVSMDVSASVPNGLWVRPHVVWDATKVNVERLPEHAELFVRKVLAQLGLELVQ